MAMIENTGSIADELHTHAEGTALWWLGNAGWAIKCDDVLLLIDPVIELSADNPSLSEIDLPLQHPLPLRAGELGEDDLDLCLVTHGHGDHLAPRTIPTLAQSTRCRFVVPGSCRESMRRLGVPEDRMIAARHGQAIAHKQVTIEPLKALHGHLQGSVYSGASFGDCGYLIRDGHWTILHPGDTVLLHEHMEMEPPDVYLASITEHNTWVRNTALLANLWKPRYVVPMHYDTYVGPPYWTVADPLSVLPHLDEEVRQRYRIVAQGEKLLLGD